MDPAQFWREALSVYNEVSINYCAGSIVLVSRTVRFVRVDRVAILFRCRAARESYVLT